MGRAVVLTAAALTMTTPARAQDGGYFGAIGGLTFGTATAPLIGGEFGRNVTGNLQIYGTFGRMSNIVPRSSQDDLDALSAVLREETGQPWSLEGKAPAIFALGGIKYSLPTAGARPYVSAGLGFADLQISVEQAELGDVTLGLIEAGLVMREPLTITNLLYEAGAGVHVPLGRVYFDLGYRLRRVRTVETTFSGAYLGFGARF
jgi:hypothetical protein